MTFMYLFCDKLQEILMCIRPRAFANFMSIDTIAANLNLKGCTFLFTLFPCIFLQKQNILQIFFLGIYLQNQQQSKHTKRIPSFDYSKF